MLLLLFIKICNSWFVKCNVSYKILFLNKFFFINFFFIFLLINLFF